MRRVDAGVIEKTQITFLHTVAQKVARLKIAHAVPVRFLVAPQIIYGIAIGFGPDDPVVGRHGRGHQKHKKDQAQSTVRNEVYRPGKTASRQKCFHRHVAPAVLCSLSYKQQSSAHDHLAIVTVLIALSAFLMLRHARQASNSSPTGSSSSQFNTLFQPSRSAKTALQDSRRSAGSRLHSGAMITGITGEHVCAPGYAQAAGSLSQNQQRLVYSAYDIALHAPDQYQIDHLISTDLGGSNGRRTCGRRAANRTRLQGKRCSRSRAVQARM